MRLKIENKTEKRFAILFAVLIAVCRTVGNAMTHTNRIQTLWDSADHLQQSIVTFIVWSAGAVLIFLLILELSKSEKLREFQYGKAFFQSRGCFCCTWGLFFLAFVICFLAYYPGVYSYDIQVETPMALGKWPVTTQHPPLHIFLWKLFLLLEAKTGWRAVTTYAIASMLFLSYSFAKIEQCVVNHSRNTVLPFFSMLLLINPTFAIMSIIPTKDTVFAGFFALNSVCLADIIFEKEANDKKRIQYAVSLLICCLFRNNAFAVFMILIPILFFSKIRYGKKLAAWAMGALLAFFLITGAVYPLLEIEKARDAEVLSIPIHQISTAVVNHANSEDMPLSIEDKQSLSNFISTEKVCLLYNPRLVDPIKYNMDFDGPDSTKEFLSLWLKMGKEYPVDYLNALLTLNLPYWYPMSNAVDEFSEKLYIETTLNIDEYYSFVSDSKLPLAKKCYEAIAEYTAELIEKIPVANQLLSLSWPFLVLLGCFCLIGAKQIHMRALIILPAFLYWGTFLTGPISNFRYIFPVMVLCPLFLLSVFGRTEQ